MTYRDGHPVRPVGGRLALDFLNTADWASDGTVVHEKIAELADLDVWLRAVGLPETVRPGSVEAIHSFRRDLRRVFRAEADARLSDLQALLGAIDLGETTSLNDLACQPALGLVAISAVSILGDPRERGRIKTCPGIDCGWMFIDETKNRRRKWCLMETCGNRAKAARHYRRLSGMAGTA